MTHSLHRFGTVESQKNDFVWFMYQAKGVNDVNSVDKGLQFIEVVEKYGSENWGDVRTGCKLEHGVEKIRENLTDRSRLRGVFTSKEQVVKFLKDIKERDLGQSVIIAGLLDEIIDACKEAGLRPHTINYSLGIWGKKELLPEDDVLAITTMCGHHMISSGIVEKNMKLVREGKKDAEKAAREMAVLCPCGIFNQVRAQEILEEGMKK
jgi:hypothetical protein